MQQVLPPEAHSWASGIHVNPDLTLDDRIAFGCFFVFAVLLGSFVFFNAANAYTCQRLGWKCFWCKETWVGRGCGCIRTDRHVGRSRVDGGVSRGKWLALDLDEKLLERARHAHRTFLKERERVGGRRASYYRVRRDDFLTALRDYMESRKRGIYR